MADFETAFIDAYRGSTSAVAQRQNGSGQIKSQLIHWEKTAAQTNGDTIFLFPVKSSDRILGIYYSSDALTGASDVNVGLWSTASTPVDVDENLFADAVDISSGAAVWTQLDEIAVENRGKPIWSLLGGTSPEDKTYFLALNLITGGTAAGSVSIRVDFLV